MLLKDFFNLVEDIAQEEIPYSRIAMYYNLNIDSFFALVYTLDSQLLETSEEIDVSANTESVEIQGYTTNYYFGIIKKVIWKDSNDICNELERRQDIVNPYNTTSTRPIYYKIVGKYLYLYPKPTRSGTLIIYGYKKFPPLPEAFSNADLNEQLKSGRISVEHIALDKIDSSMNIDLPIPSKYIKYFATLIAVDCVTDIKMKQFLQNQLRFELSKIYLVNSQGEKPVFRHPLEDVWEVM